MNTRRIQRRKWGKKELLAFKKGVIFTWKRLDELANRCCLHGKRDVFEQFFETDMDILWGWKIVISYSLDLGHMPVSRNLHHLHLINQKIEQTLNDLS